jgi:hypothetical protein
MDACCNDLLLAMHLAGRYWGWRKGSTTQKVEFLNAINIHNYGYCK